MKKFVFLMLAAFLVSGTALAYDESLAKTYEQFFAPFEEKQVVKALHLLPPDKVVEAGRIYFEPYSEGRESIGLAEATKYGAIQVMATAGATLQWDGGVIEVAALDLRRPRPRAGSGSNPRRRSR